MVRGTVLARRHMFSTSKYCRVPNFIYTAMSLTTIRIKKSIYIDKLLEICWSKDYGIYIRARSIVIIYLVSRYTSIGIDKEFITQNQKL